MKDTDLMPFGKYQGEKMANVPDSYLKWLYDTFVVTPKKWNKVYYYIKENIESIEAKCKRNLYK